MQFPAFFRHSPWAPMLAAVLPLPFMLVGLLVGVAPSRH